MSRVGDIGGQERERAVRWRMPAPPLLAELALWLGLGLALANLGWAVVTPVGALGSAPAAGPPVADLTILDRFDPFDRSAAMAPGTVTGLDLKLFGVRLDRASGRGGAIIGTADGRQDSYAVGDEVAPGVRLAGVAFDGVTLDRGGRREQLLLDQSAPARTPPPATGSPPLSLSRDIRLFPTNGGIALTPAGDGRAFAAAGLRAGDRLVSLDGRRIASAESALNAAANIRPGAPLLLTVARGAATASITVTGQP